MRITKKRVNNVAPYLSAVPPESRFRLIVEAGSVRPEMLTRLGFSNPAVDGETILPRAIGPVSRYNADGAWRVMRDQPKEPRYIRTVQWTWRQWTGGGHSEEHTEFRDIFRDCYPREFVSPPSLELTYREVEGRGIITSAEFENLEVLHPLNKHAINLFLEIFKSCEIVTTDLASFVPPEVRYANWRLLPPGEHPWERLEEHIHRAVRASSSGTREVIWDRQTTLRGYDPAEIYLGNGGFDDYLAYIFRDRGLVVLESIRKDNAIYVFGLDWERLSQMTKAQIIANNLHEARIVHTLGWKGRLREVLSRPAAGAAAR